MAPQSGRSVDVHHTYRFVSQPHTTAPCLTAEGRKFVHLLGGRLAQRADLRPGNPLPSVPSGSPGTSLGCAAASSASPSPSKTADEARYGNDGPVPPVGYVTASASVWEAGAVLPSNSRHERARH